MADWKSLIHASGLTPITSPVTLSSIKSDLW